LIEERRVGGDRRRRGDAAGHVGHVARQGVRHGDPRLDLVADVGHHDGIGQGVAGSHDSGGIDRLEDVQRGLARVRHHRGRVVRRIRIRLIRRRARRDVRDRRAHGIGFHRRRDGQRLRLRHRQRADVPEPGAGVIGALRSDVGHVGQTAGQQIRHPHAGGRVRSEVGDGHRVDQLLFLDRNRGTHGFAHADVHGLHRDDRRILVVGRRRIGLVQRRNPGEIGDRRAGRAGLHVRRQQQAGRAPHGQRADVPEARRIVVGALRRHARHVGQAAGQRLDDLQAGRRDRAFVRHRDRVADAVAFRRMGLVHGLHERQIGIGHRIRHRGSHVRGRLVAGDGDDVDDLGRAAGIVHGHFERQGQDLAGAQGPIRGQNRRSAARDGVGRERHRRHLDVVQIAVVAVVPVGAQVFEPDRRVGRQERSDVDLLAAAGRAGVGAHFDERIRPVGRDQHRDGLAADEIDGLPVVAQDRAGIARQIRPARGPLVPHVGPVQEQLAAAGGDADVVSDRTGGPRRIPFPPIRIPIQRAVVVGVGLGVEFIPDVDGSPVGAGDLEAVRDVGGAGRRPIRHHHVGMGRCARIAHDHGVDDVAAGHGKARHVRRLGHDQGADVDDRRVLIVGRDRIGHVRGGDAAPVGDGRALGARIHGRGDPQRRGFARIEVAHRPEARTAVVAALADGVRHVGRAVGQRLAHRDARRIRGAVVGDDDRIEQGVAFVRRGVVRALENGQIRTMHSHRRLRGVVRRVQIGLVQRGDGHRIGPQKPARSGGGGGVDLQRGRGQRTEMADRPDAGAAGIRALAGRVRGVVEPRRKQIRQFHARGVRPRAQIGRRDGEFHRVALADPGGIRRLAHADVDGDERIHDGIRQGNRLEFARHGSRVGNGHQGQRIVHHHLEGHFQRLPGIQPPPRGQIGRIARRSDRVGSGHIVRHHHASCRPSPAGPSAIEGSQPTPAGPARRSARRSVALAAAPAVASIAAAARRDRPGRVRGSGSSRIGAGGRSAAPAVRSGNAIRPVAAIVADIPDAGGGRATRRAVGIVLDPAAPPLGQNARDGTETEPRIAPGRVGRPAATDVHDVIAAWQNRHRSVAVASAAPPAAAAIGRSRGAAAAAAPGRYGHARHARGRGEGRGGIIDRCRGNRRAFRIAGHGGAARHVGRAVRHHVRQRHVRMRDRAVIGDDHHVGDRSAGLHRSQNVRRLVQAQGADRHRRGSAVVGRIGIRQAAGGDRGRVGQPGAGGRRIDGRVDLQRGHCIGRQRPDGPDARAAGIAALADRV